MQPQKRFLLCLMVFASGATSLIYQIAWVRSLTIGFGNTTQAISTVLTVFMAGLAIGYHVLGRRADHQSEPLRVYAALELALGIWAALLAGWLPAINAWTLSWASGHSQLSTALSFLVSIACLLPPCTLMGGTLPVLSRSNVRHANARGAGLTQLYAWNTLGAVTGCLAAACFLIRQWGLTRSMLLAAGTNLVLAVLAWCVSDRRSNQQACAPATVEPLPAGAGNGNDEPLPQERFARVQQARQLGSVAFVSGGLLMASEVFWTRLCANLLTGNVLVFAAIVAGFLTGMGTASLWISRTVDRWVHPKRVVSVCLILSGGWLTVAVLGQDRLAQMFRNIQATGVSGAGSLAALYMLTAIPAATLGAIMPAMIRINNDSLDSVGRDLGRLFAINTMGSIVGSFVSGFIMLPAVGLNVSLLLSAATYVLLAAVIAPSRSLRFASGLALLCCMSLLLIPRTYQPRFWFNAGFTAAREIAPSEILMLREGVEATVGVARHKGVISLSTNGTVVADTSRHDLWDLLLKAHLPMLLHQNPRDVALVGLGAGISLGAVGSYDVHRIDCVEISTDVVDAQHYFSGFHDDPLTSPKVHLWIDDGRHFLSSTQQSYDVISVDPVDPPICNQYTQEFFAICRQRLRQKGLMVQWVPLFHLETHHLRIIARTFLNEFPHSSLWYDGTSLLLIGSRGQPLQVDLRVAAKRIALPNVQRSLSRIQHPPLLMLLSTFVAGSEQLRQFAAKSPLSNTDDRPILEYSLLLEPRPTNRSYAANLAALQPLQCPLKTVLANPLDLPPTARRELERQRRILLNCMQIRIHRLRSEFGHAESLRRTTISKFELNPGDLSLYQAFLE